MNRLNSFFLAIFDGEENCYPPTSDCPKLKRPKSVLASVGSLSI